MIKGSARTALGLPLLFLGLSGENIARLAAGEPIRVSAQEAAALGLPPVEVVIHYGRTERDILDDVQKHGIKLRANDPG